MPLTGSEISIYLHYPLNQLSLLLSCCFGSGVKSSVQFNLFLGNETISPLLSAIYSLILDMVGLMTFNQISFFSCPLVTILFLHMMVHKIGILTFPTSDSSKILQHKYK